MGGSRPCAYTCSNRHGCLWHKVTSNLHSASVIGISLFIFPAMEEARIPKTDLLGQNANIALESVAISWGCVGGGALGKFRRAHCSVCGSSPGQQVKVLARAFCLIPPEGPPTFQSGVQMAQCLGCPTCCSPEVLQTHPDNCKTGAK